MVRPGSADPRVYLLFHFEGGVYSDRCVADSGANLATCGKHVRCTTTCLVGQCTPGPLYNSEGGCSITEHFTKMRSLRDEMAVAGKPLDDEEMTAYILNGLDIDYEPIVSAVLTSENPISLTELYSQLLSFESRVELKGTSGYSANVCTSWRTGCARRACLWAWTWDMSWVWEHVTAPWCFPPTAAAYSNAFG